MSNLKQLLLLAAITTAPLSLEAQKLPSEKSAKSYFSELQTKRVTSTDYIQWHQFGPGTSGYCEMVWCHPTDPKTLIMSPDMHNTYGSWDGGESWTTVKDVDDNRVIFNRVMCLAFAPTKPDFALAVDGRGLVMKSTDKGHSWHDTGFAAGHHSAIAVDPTNEKIWYMGPGRFWDVKKNHKTAKNMADPSVDIRKKNEGYIYISTNAGNTWDKVSEGIPANIEVGRFIINPANTKEIFMATNQGIFKSTNRGRSWSESFDGIPNRAIRDLDYHYDSKSKKLTLFALDQTSYIPDGKSIRSEGGVYRSNDLGKSWRCITGDLAIDLSRVTGKTVDWLYSRTVTSWLGISAGELRSSYPERPKSILSVYNRLRVNPKNPDEIYICGNHKHDFGFEPGDIWKSNNGGKNWYPAARTGEYWLSETNADYWAERAAPKGMNTLYSHMDRHQRARSETWGTRFMEVDINGTVYACIEQQMMRSTNGGESWEQYDDIEREEGSGYWIGRGASNLPGRYILLETGIKERILLCSGEHGLWQTDSREGTPTEPKVAVKQIEGQCNVEHSAHSIASVAVDPQDPNIIYTIQFRQEHRGFFRRSTDGGKTWENIAEPLPWDGNPSAQHIFQYSLMVDPSNGKNIYFCAIDNYIADVLGSQLPNDKYPDFGVHRSHDGGFTWEKANNGLPEKCSVRRLAMHPKSPEILYAALNLSRSKSSGGLYISKNRGDKWEKMEIPEEIISVNNIFVDRNNLNLYISCGTDTGTAEAGGVWRSRNNGKSWEKIFFLDYIWQCETSPVDPDIITVVAAGKRKDDMNPGAYVSTDGGKSWKKVNQNLGQPNTITDFKPDTYDTKKFWAALKGSGWAIGYVK